MRDHIGPDPVVWVERLRHVNETSSFPELAKGRIERMLAELERVLRSAPNIYRPEGAKE